MSKQEQPKSRDQQFAEYVASLENQVTISHQKAQDVAKQCMGNILQQLQQSMQMTGAKEAEIKRLQDLLTTHKIDYAQKPPNRTERRAEERKVAKKTK